MPKGSADPNIVGTARELAGSQTALASTASTGDAGGRYHAQVKGGAGYLRVVPTGGPAEILFQVAGLDEVAAPLATQSMLTATGSTRRTRYDPAAHGMLEVLNQTSRYEPPAVPPFVLRPIELPVANPLVEEHHEIEAFLAENLSAGTSARAGASRQSR